MQRGASEHRQVEGGEYSYIERIRVSRIRMLGIIFSLWVALLTHRLLSLQVLDVERWSRWAQTQHESEYKIAGQRGALLDRQGKLLAVSVPSGSVYARPRFVKNKGEVARVVSSILQIDEQEVLRKLESKKTFVWLERQIPKVRAEQVKALDFQGIDFLIESKRYYPFNEAASRLLGKVGIDGIGLSGLEAAYEKVLQQKEFKQHMLRDALGNQLHVSNASYDFEMPQGQGLMLSIDAEIQQVMDVVLQQAHEEAQAKRVMGIMINSLTGELLAMSQTPHVNFNERSPLKKDDMKLDALQTVYEPGSTLKPFVIAKALENGLVEKGEMFTCAEGSLRIGRKVIKDVHFHPTLSLRDVLVRSSNIGMSRIGLRFGKEGLYESLRSFGFGEKISLGLPGASRGIFRHWKSWAEIDMATHAFGQGIAVTPLQMLRAVGAIANGGMLRDISIQKISENEIRGERVLSASVARTVRDMMVAVVEDEHGTGKRARIPGVLVGGKTGTAQKASPQGGYLKGTYIASFLGFADMRSAGLDSVYSLYIVVDEPNNGKIYGGTLAGPPFKEIMQKTIRILQTRKVLQRHKREQTVTGVALASHKLAPEKILVDTL